VDRDGRVAATMFLRRGVSGMPCLDVHTLELTDAGWRMLGGGSDEGADDLVAARPRLLDLGAPAVAHGGGGTAGSASRLRPWRRTWVSYAVVRAAAEAAALQVTDRRVPVHRHGLAVVVWPGHDAPEITALDASASALGPVAVRVARRDPPRGSASACLKSSYRAV
jgi:hypothetical protein